MTTSIDVSAGPETAHHDNPDEIEGKSLKALAWARLRHDKVAVVAMVALVVILLLAVFAPIIVRIFSIDPYAGDRSVLDDNTGGLPRGWLHSGISWNHPLGAEPGTGRDIAGMLLYGMRISLLISISAVLLTVLLGTVVGIVSGYARGWVDGLIGRIMDLLLAFPLLLIVLAMSPVLIQRLEAIGVPEGNFSRIVYLILVIAFFYWPYLARIVRGQVISLREREFVEAAVSLGGSTNRILFRELLPNLWAPILVYATISLPNFISLEASLSYLGVGVLPPQPTWGKMLSDSATYWTIDPLYLFVPGTALIIVVLAFNVLGDAVRDALDPRASRA
jgi:peptide/nickel transport system permease protein